MSKSESPDTSDKNSVQSADNQNKMDGAKKHRIELPPLVEMMIAFSRTAVVLVAVMVALISINLGCDLLTIFIRTMVSLIGSGLLLWLISWWITQLYFEGLVTNQKNQIGESPEGTIKDFKA